jgi:hypothetical protein
MADQKADAESISFVPARKGGFHLKDGKGYLYFKSKTVLPKDRIYWTCLNKKAFICNATAITQHSTKTLLTLGGHHSHGTSLLEMKTRAVESEKVIAAASMPTVAPRTILGVYLPTDYYNQVHIPFFEVIIVS